MSPQNNGIRNLDPKLLVLPDRPSRRVRTEAEWDTLTESVRVHGVLQPVIARTLPDGRTQAVSGVGRVVVARKLGLATVPVVVKSLTDEQAVLLAGDDNRSQGRWHFLNDILECKELQRLKWKQRVLANRFRVNIRSIQYWLRIAHNLPVDALNVAIDIACTGPQRLKRSVENTKNTKPVSYFSPNSAKFTGSFQYWELTQDMLYEASWLGLRATEFIRFCASKQLDGDEAASAAAWAQEPKNKLSDWTPTPAMTTSPAEPAAAPAPPPPAAPAPVATAPAVSARSLPPAPPPAAPPSAAASAQQDPKAEYRAKLAEFLRRPLGSQPAPTPQAPFPAVSPSAAVSAQPDPKAECRAKLAEFLKRDLSQPAPAPATPAAPAPVPVLSPAAPPSPVTTTTNQQEAKKKYRAMLEEFLKKPLCSQSAPVIAAPAATVPPPATPILTVKIGASPALSRKEVWLSRAVGAGVVAALALGIWSDLLHVGWFAKSLLWLALAGGTAGWYRLPIGFRESAARLSLRAARFAKAKAALAFRFFGLKLQEGWRNHPWWMCIGVLSGLVTIGLWVTARPFVFILWGLALVSALVWTIEERGRTPGALRRA